MIITAHIKITRQQLETILAANSQLGTLKEIADHDQNLVLEWLDDDTIELKGRMSDITRVVEDWQPESINLISFTEDDEL